MTLSIFIALGFLCALLYLKKYYRSSRALAIVLTILFLMIGYGPLPYWLATRLQHGYMTDYHGQWGARSVIVLLGAGTEKVALTNDVETNMIGYARLTRAYAQYISCKQQGGACTLLVTGGDPQHHGAAEAAIYGLTLRRLGVPTSDLVTEEQSKNTFQNAQFTQPLLKALQVDTIVLVTSGSHMYRSQLYFSHFGIHAAPVRAEYITASFHVMPTFYNFVVMDVVVHEYVGIASYYAYRVLELI